MKWLSAGLTLVNISTVCGLLLGIAFQGVNRSVAVVSMLVGLVAAFFAYRATGDSSAKKEAPATPPELEKPESKRARRRDRVDQADHITASVRRYRSAWLWLMVGVFAIFAFRSFCWLLYLDNNEFKIQSPNNLGDLSLHITYIKNFASGVPLWPENPIYIFSKIRYPAGTDLFNALLARLQVDLIRGLVWTALLASAAACYAFYRWAGSFGLAGFLFNGGLVGFQVLKTFEFLDYQGDKTIAWKSIPLSMFVTQRGLLYALPAGLLLLYQWRAKYSSPLPATSPSDAPSSSPSPSSSSTSSSHGFETAAPWKKPPLPFWLELSLYASMPLFHAHTFLALSIALAVLFVCGDGGIRKHIGTLIALAFIPATFFSWLITDHFQAGSVLAWQPGWVQSDGDFLRPFSHSTAHFGALNPLVNFVEFWTLNLGLWVPVVLALVGWSCWRTWKEGVRWGTKLPEDTAFLLAATAIFLFAFFVKAAPWGWDNLKIIIWAYFIVLPYLWAEMISRWSMPIPALLCIALFGSGFVTLFGGLKAGRPGFGLADRGEVDAVGVEVKKLPLEARYATHPTYNHPLLLQGRKVVAGYPGHLWTQGFSDHEQQISKLRSILQGAPNWKQNAKYFQVRYLFWGREEKTNYPTSRRPWERESRLVASGSWGAIYDLEAPRDPRQKVPGDPTAMGYKGQ